MSIRMRSARWRAVAAIVVLAGLAGCATAPVLKQDASEVLAATGTSLTATRAFYAKLATTRRHYQLAVLASDPRCGLAWHAVVLPDRDAPYGLRCLDDDERAVRQACLDDPPSPPCDDAARTRLVTQAVTLDLDDAERTTALALVDVIARYQVALAAILLDDVDDARAMLTALRDGLFTVEATIAALQGSDAAPDTYKTQLEAAATLATLIEKSAEDHADLVALRALLARDGVALETAMTRLATRYESLDRQRLAAFDRVQLAHRLDRFNATQAKLAEDKRLDQMRALADEYVELQRRAQGPDALVLALQALAKNQATLRAAVVDGTLDDAQRRRIAAQSLRQLKAWFDAIATLARVG